MKALVINQDNQTIRMDFQVKQLTELGLTFQRIPAYSISGDTDKTFLKLFNNWQRPLSPSEVSCFLSHKTAWEIVASSESPMLILEDDAWLDTNISKVLNTLSDMDGIEYVTFEVTGSKRKKLIAKQPVKQIEGSNLLRLYQGRSGAGGYALWPEGAKKLLDQAQNSKIGLADKFICSCYSVRGYQVEPALVIQLDQCKFYGINPPIEVKTTINARPESRPNLIPRVRYRTRRFIGEIRVGINLLRHSFGTERRQIALSNNFKKRSQQ